MPGGQKVLSTCVFNYQICLHFNFHAISYFSVLLLKSDQYLVFITNFNLFDIVCDKRQQDISFLKAISYHSIPIFFLSNSHFYFCNFQGILNNKQLNLMLGRRDTIQFVASFSCMNMISDYLRETPKVDTKCKQDFRCLL